MINLVKMSLVVEEQPISTVACKLSRSKLYKLAEELCIPFGELNKIAGEVFGKTVTDCSKLSETENKELRRYIEAHRRIMMDRGRRVVWNTQRR